MSRFHGKQQKRAQFIGTPNVRAAPKKIDADHLRQQYQNKVNQAQGQHFEDLIDAGCEYYRARGLADIEKTPEPLRPVQDMGGGLFLARYTKKGQTDYKGCMRGGQAIYLEAKYTDTGRMQQDRVTENQTKRLDRAQSLGALAFVLCSFGAVGFYRIPWPIWKTLKQLFGHKYITPQEAAPYEVRIGGPGVLLFLEGIEKEENL